MKQTILVVDDHDDEREALATLLERHHYRVESATNGQEAIDRLRRGGILPALVLLDLNMPVMDGWEFLFHVGQDPSLRQVAIIVLSGSPRVKEVLTSPPGVSFVAKPIKPAMILKVIADLFQRPAAPSLSDGAVVAARDIDTERHGVRRMEIPLAID